jgi:cytochrome c biogenesis protein CcdA
LAVQLSTGATGLSIGSFLAGCIGGYIAFAAGGVLVSFVQAASPFVYALAGVTLAAVGLRYLLVPHEAQPCSARRGSNSLGTRFLGGLLCSVAGTPCCTPVAIALGAQSATYDVGFGAMTLAAFGAGQVLPLVGLSAASRIPPIAALQIPAPVLSTVGGTLLIAMGGLYGAIA